MNLATQRCTTNPVSTTRRLSHAQNSLMPSMTREKQQRIPSQQISSSHGGLMITQMTRHHWTLGSLTDPSVVYQLALRAGASFEATTIALLRHRLVSESIFSRLRQTTVKEIKQSLLEGVALENWYPDVWLLTEADEGTIIEGDARDVFVVRLKEQSAAGYLWDIDDLGRADFALLRDDRQISDSREDIGRASC